MEATYLKTGKKINVRNIHVSDIDKLVHYSYGDAQNPVRLDGLTKDNICNHQKCFFVVEGTNKFLINDEVSFIGNE